MKIESLYLNVFLMEGLLRSYDLLVCQNPSEHHRVIGLETPYWMVIYTSSAEEPISQSSKSKKTCNLLFANTGIPKYWCFIIFAKNQVVQ